MKNISEQELRSVNGGYYYHCRWCCGHYTWVDFYNTISGYLHTKSSTHKKWWAKGKGVNKGKCAHYM